MKQYRPSHDEISALCLELELLLRAGADCADGLALLARECENDNFRELLNGLALRMDEGAALSKAIEESGAFPAAVTAMLRVGEKAGRAEEALGALARYHDARSQMDNRLRSSLLYPSVLLIVMLVVIVVLLTKVFPIFNDVYASLGGQLTGVAGGLLELGRALNTILPVLCVILALFVVALILFSCSDKIRARIVLRWQKNRGDKGLSRKLNTARFAQALSMALHSGMDTDEALEAAGELLGEQSSAARRISSCKEALAEGETFAHALRSSGLIPPAECRILELGILSGNNEAAMEEIAARLERDAEESMDRTLSKVEPTMVITASLLVGIILLSVMLPLTRIMTALG